MNAKPSWCFGLMASALMISTSSGCFQTTIGGQTLPSAYYLDDDVQYFPKGPEQRLSNQIRSLERYKADGAAKQQGLNSPAVN